MNHVPRSLLIGWVAICLIPGLLNAQSIRLNTYHDFRGMQKALQTLIDGYPDLLSLESAGESLQGRAIDVVTLTAGGHAGEKPAILVVGGVEGKDVAASEACLGIIQSLATGYTRADSIARMLEHTTYYIFPRVNPDATEAYFAAPLYERTLNTRPMDLDEDGAMDEDGYDDLNGDGLITLMRIPDPAGEWMPDPDNPRLMRKADPGKGETGQYRVLTEGFDNDGDGEFNEDEPGGVNFNRNFSFGYTYFQRGAGPHQVSELETRAVADFAFGHKNIAAVFSFSQDDNLMYPWESRRNARGDRRGSREPVTSVLPEDAIYYQEMGEKFRSITGLSNAPKPEELHGGFTPWAYYDYGRWSFSVPVWWPPEAKAARDTGRSDSLDAKEDTKQKAGQNTEDFLVNQRRLLRWLDSTNQSAGFVEWTAVEHPGFPDTTVEVGGFRPYIAENPPLEYLDFRLEKYGNFLTELGSLLPRVSLEKVTVKNLHRNVYRISMVVTNQGYLPTSSHLGIRNRWAPQVKVAIQIGEDQILASGRAVQMVDAIPGSGASQEFQWVVTGPQGSRATLTAGSPMAGRDQQTVELR